MRRKQRLRRVPRNNFLIEHRTVMTEPNTLGGLIGGGLIGLAAVLLLALNGRIARISGIWAS
jgi:hypothetical protein